MKSFAVRKLQLDKPADGFKHAERHSERRWGASRPKRPGGGASLQGLEAVTDTQGITSP
jgi:hypothetical protein